MTKISILLPLILVVLVGPASCFINTTQFWRKTLNLTQIHYQSYAGFQQIDWYYSKDKTGMFYTLIGGAGRDIMEQSDSTPLLIWLQGGPGTASQYGSLTQIGPVRIEDGIVKQFPYSWIIFGHLLFIDSPLRTGFSFNKDNRQLVSSTSQATDHLLNFLSNFYQQFPSLKKSPLYLCGESYAGHYIPNLAKKILANSTFIQKTGVKLVGIALGNAWVDPINQANYFDTFLWSVGVASNKLRSACTSIQTYGIINIYQGKFKNATEYLNFIINNNHASVDYMGNISIYNFRKQNTDDRSPENFLTNNKAEFGSQNEYTMSNPFIYNEFSADISQSYVSDLAAVLKTIKVLIFNGQNDFIINTPGVLQYLNGMSWEGINQWKKTNKKIWTRYGDTLGWVKNSGNLWFVLVNDAGHMVSADKPESAFSMMGHFIFNDQNWQQ